MTWRKTAARFEVSERTVARVVREAGGVPAPLSSRSERVLSLAEREEVRAGLERGDSFAAIGRTLGRPTSTISREVARNGGRVCYLGWAADRRADQLARRPKVGKLAVQGELREFVLAGLRQRWSPEQISARLVEEFPDRPEMRVSHETIYQSLFVQARGQFRKDLTVYLRSGRSRRKPQRGEGETGRPRGIVGMVNISQRPAEIEDRAVPGHWEGDLIIGANSRSAIVTLVERSTRYVMLARIDGRHDAPTTCAALTNTIGRLPEQLRRSLTWDQGREMADHAHFTIATDVAVYFCDPHSPWQRGSNENTNGLLRQYFPKSTDLSEFTQADLDDVAHELNGRPRQTLGWMKPSEKFNELVALTA
ncbi:MAG: IS30 family transposase [Ilumatobacteraceae bacterium]